MANAAAEFEIREAMIAVARSLPPKEQVAFVLKEVFDLTAEEIARVACSMSTMLPERSPAAA